MSEFDRGEYRKAAVDCVELARVTADPNMREALLIRAQEWLRLAYSGHDEKFEELLGEFNAKQLGRPTVQRQPVQQQQSRKEPER